MDIEQKRPDGKPRTLPVDTLPVPDEPKQKKVSKLAAFWAKTATHKRNIGFILIGAGVIVRVFFSPVGLILEGVGGILSGVGVIDDLIRKNKTKKETGAGTDWESIIKTIIEFLKSLLKRS